MVYRVYVEKKPEYAVSAKGLLSDIKTFLGISEIENVRIINRYDAEEIDAELFEKAVPLVFSEPQLDNVYYTLPDISDAKMFVYEALPGQFDQRADSAQQCIQLISQKERPIVKSAQIVVLYGNLSDDDVIKVKNYLINPVESRETDDTLPEKLKMEVDLPDEVPVIENFTSLDEEGLKNFISEYALSMDEGDIRLIQQYFISERRNPTLTEIRVIDTYWSDHCRHTTFNTELDQILLEESGIVKESFDRYCAVRKELNRSKPVTLMDIATIGTKYLKSKGSLKNLDESEEINACSIKVTPTVDGKAQDWLLMFKNETHNHPTEIEPFGGAATCIGGAIRDPLSGRSYVYQAMRVSGAADPTKDINETINGKLPQRKIVTSAAAGYSSYGNQIGLATGLVDEIYHPGYVAKHMELGFVLGAAPEENVVREKPKAGDIVILLGGRTGRDGCGGATGSSKSHDVHSLTECGSEVQKGNAPEERKLQRLFRNPKATKLIKRCNDFGAGGVSVAIGELADGLEIQLDRVPKKYEGLSATELAISESQERMAVVVAAQDVNAFCAYAQEENLEATVVAKVTDAGRLIMNYNGRSVVDISRDFLNTNGSPKRTKAKADSHKVSANCGVGENLNFADRMLAYAQDLNICSKRGLSERFDSTIGASSVLMPFGGTHQRTPQQSMVALLPVLDGKTDMCSVAAYGFNPYISEESPYHGAYLAIVQAITRAVATGCDTDSIYLTLQEFFERLTDEESWGKPLSALLGALDAQIDYGYAAIGGKDSMSGTFENIHVPPTLVAFAVGTGDINNIVSNEFKAPYSKVYMLKPTYRDTLLPESESLKSNMRLVESLIKEGKVLSAYAVGYGGVAEAVIKMSAGYKLGFDFDDNIDKDDIFNYNYGTFVLEMEDAIDIPELVLLGETTGKNAVTYKGESVSSDILQNAFEERLTGIFPNKADKSNVQCDVNIPTFASDVHIHASNKIAVPKVLIPVFPGTNCEFDSAKAFKAAGADVCILPIRNLESSDVSLSVNKFVSELKKSQILFLPGGFSAGDEPEGSGKFITSFLRNPKIQKEIDKLLNTRDGLIGGICNGFQALIKLGLVPYGEIRDTDDTYPTLTYNDIGRHVSKLVRTKIVSNKSPWLMYTKPDEVYTVPISHGEGKFVCSEELFKELCANNQIATQYVGVDLTPSMDPEVNPNGSYYAIEGITSPDGRVFGKMGHSERVTDGIYKNVVGNMIMPMFKGAVDYFKE